MASIISEIAARRSIRKYTDEKIPEGYKKEIIAAGLLGASSRNIRPIELIGVEDKELLEKLSHSRQIGSPQVAGADLCIVVAADESKSDAWIEDAVIALDNMHLAASALGVGSCWIQVRNRMAADNYTTEEYIKELLGIPGTFRVEGMMSFGMPAETKEPYDVDKADFGKYHKDKF